MVLMFLSGEEEGVSYRRRRREERERVCRPPLGRGALVKVVHVDEDDVICFDERSDVSNFYEADERET